MRFNTHSIVAGRHAFLSPSSYHWIRYDEDKLDRVFNQSLEAQRGTELHAVAHQLIKLGVKLPENGQTLSMYVNDAIGFGMKSEVTLFYSPNCHGSPDSIDFNIEKQFLRIHDLKTGLLKASMDQLLIYAALFCLEYRQHPNEIKMELRIYQNNAIETLIPEVTDIFHIIDRIITFDKRINQLRAEETI